jgi:hypothetical protein
VVSSLNFTRSFESILGLGSNCVNLGLMYETTGEEEGKLLEELENRITNSKPPLIPEWTRWLIVDVALVHDFHGNVIDPARHGQPRHPNPDKVLINTAVAKAQGNEYRPDYLRNHNKAFLPLVMSTSGRLHSEFVRLLYVLAHQRAVRFFATLNYEPCDEELCQRRGAFFFQHRARIGLGGAQATALRMGAPPRPPVGARRPPLRPFSAPVPFPLYADLGPLSRIPGA